MFFSCMKDLSPGRLSYPAACQAPSSSEQTCQGVCPFSVFATCGVFSGCTSSENTRIGSHHLSITIYSSYTAFWRRAGIHWSLTVQPDKGLLQAWNRCHQWNLWERHEILWEAVAFSATFLGSHQLWFNKVLPATGKGFHSCTASLRCICLNNNSCFFVSGVFPERRPPCRPRLSVRVLVNLCGFFHGVCLLKWI